jgi:glycoside/pentoside/hexuronide:cation symporter, GPH family
MMPIVRLIGAFDDPIMGLVADRTQTRWGKFRPYLLWGAIPYGICGCLMFAGPNLGSTVKLISLARPRTLAIGHPPPLARQPARYAG